MSSSIITVFNNEGCRRYLLPATDNTDYELILYEKYFWLEMDQKIQMECIRGKWAIRPDDICRLFEMPSEAQLKTGVRHDLVDNEVVKIITPDGEILHALIQTKEALFLPSPVIPLEKLDDIHFGTSENGGIVIPSGIYDEEMDLTLRKEWHGYSAVPNAGIFYLNGRILRRETALHYGDIIELPGFRLQYLGTELAVLAGFSLLTITPEVRTAEIMQRESAVVNPVGDAASGRNATTNYHRPPRVLPGIYRDTIKIEAAPELGDDDERSVRQAVLQSAMMVIPMMLASVLMIYASHNSAYGGSIMMYSGVVMALSTGVIGVAMALFNRNEQKSRRKQKESRRFDAYSSYLIDMTENIRKKYASNINSMHKTYPDTNELLKFKGQDSNLWNRNSRQDDFMQVRVGIGDVPFQVEIDVPDAHFSVVEDELREKPAFIKKNFSTLYNVPVLVDFYEHSLVGIVGGEDKKGAYELMHVICAQLAATHCYTDVRMIFFYNENNSSDMEQWDFAKWLPHSFSANRKFRMTAVSAAQVSDICFELSSIFRKRVDKITNADMSEKKEKSLPHFVLFLSDPSVIQGGLLSRYVFSNSGNLGLTTVFLSDNFENLPNECRFILQNDGEFSGIVETMETSREHTRVAFDKVPVEALNAFSASISSLRVEETDENGEIPEAVTFFEMYGVHKLSDFNSEKLWRKNKIYEHVSGLLGIKAGDVPMYLDVHEKMHGPHGLVAGTTGSGKSETLQSYLLSLAIEYSPDDIGFFIIDYKGGGMANLFDGLPHLLGSISNLSGAQIHRAMVAIKSENQRRQKMFNRAGVNNINKYTVMYKNGEVSEPIPHLFIIIDEFAELKREEPDFMKELISVAQVGRSLGVHLILSTQRPTGTVDDNIASNAKFRLCLRVQTKEDSMDMLGKPDAAFITQAGRCYLQVGNDEIYELFQSGYSGAIYNPDEIDSGRLTRLLTPICRDDIVAGAVGGRGKKSENNKQEELTQLDAVKNYLSQIAKEGQYKEAHRLWLPLLKTSICLNEIPEYSESVFRDGNWAALPGEWELNTVIGVVDDPANQAQDALFVDFGNGGNHAVIGQVVTGKSTLLQTVVYSLVNRYSPEYLTIYGLDFSSRMLSVFEKLPHVGGIMFEGDEDKIARFFHMISKRLENRKKLFRGGNYSQYYRAHGLHYPAILIVFDNFGSFNEKTNGKYLEEVIRLSKEGESNGIYLLISGGGFSMAEIPNRLGNNLKTCLCLELKDRYAYVDYLHTMRFDVLPEPGVRGRGLCVLEGRVLEYQTALSLPAGDDYERMQKIEEECEQLRLAWKGATARIVPVIPENPDWEGFSTLEDTKEAFENAALLPIGYREDNAEVYSLDLSRIFIFMVTGTARSGKTGFLNLIALSAMQKPGAEIVVFGDDVLTGLPAGTERVTYAKDADGMYEVCNTSLTKKFIERRTFSKKLEEQGLEPEDMFEEMSAEYAPIFLFIEDLPQLLTIAREDNRGIGSFLENLARKGEGHMVYLIVSFSIEDKVKLAGSSLAEAMTANGDGIHFGGYTGQNPYMKFDYLSFVEQNKAGQKGIGLLSDTPDSDGVHSVVIPAVRRSRKEGKKNDIDRSAGAGPSAKI